MRRRTAANKLDFDEIPCRRVDARELDHRTSLETEAGRGTHFERLRADKLELEHDSGSRFAKS